MDLLGHSGVRHSDGAGPRPCVRAGYQDSGAADPFAYLLPENSRELAALEAAPEVKVVAPRLNFGGLVSHGETTLSFVGEGVDAEKEKLVSDELHITQGEGLSG